MREALAKRFCAVIMLEINDQFIKFSEGKFTYFILALNDTIILSHTDKAYYYATKIITTEYCCKLMANYSCIFNTKINDDTTSLHLPRHS